MDLETPRTSRAPRLAIGSATTCLSLSGVWLLWGCLELSWISWKPPFYPDDSLREQVGTFYFHWVWLCPAGILVLYIPYFLSIYLAPKARGAFWIGLLFSVLCRVALVPGAPILETDIYRYLWDGRMVGMGQNPYRYSPLEVYQALGDPEPSEREGLRGIVNEIRGDPLFVEILGNINNKKVPTIYSPTAQAAFAIGSVLIGVCVPTDPNAIEWDGSQQVRWAIVVWKAFLLLFECGILWMIVSLLKRLSAPTYWVIVYGWSPLVLKEYSNAGHFDPIVVFFLLVALRILLGVPGARIPGHLPKRIAGGIALALSIGVKIFPFLFLPILWKRLRLPGLVAAGCVVALLHLPFLGVGERVFTGLATYSDHWENNSGLVSPLEWGVSRIQELIRRTGKGGEGGGPGNELFEFAGVPFYLDAFFVAKAISGCLLLGGIVWITRRSRAAGAVGLEADRKMLQEVYWIVGLLLIASPAVFPWYVGWIVPFLCFFPNRAWFYLSMATQVYYLRFWAEPIDYVRLEDLPFLGIDSGWEIARPLEYIPFFLLLLYGWRRQRRSATTDDP